MKSNILKLLSCLLLIILHWQAVAQKQAEAIRLSHSGKYEEAESIFKDLISKDGNNTGLLVAAGFNNTWNKEYAAAKSKFSRVLQLDPLNIDAAKGLAYISLYKEQYNKAAIAFRELAKTHPATEEFHMALGLAYMNLQQKAKARAAFQQVLKINSQNKDAGNFIKEINSKKGIAEVSVVAGFSNYDQENKFGLRQVQFGYHVNAENFLYARYDNSLSMDNYVFLKSRFNANTFSAGFYSRWHHNIASRVEYGSRQLPAGINQHIIQTEQFFFLSRKFILKAGGSMILSDKQGTESMLTGGVSLPITKKLRLEPQYYFIKRESEEHRVLINAVYHFTSITDIALGVFNGSEKNIKSNIHNKVLGIYAYSNFHIRGPLSGILMARYERDAAAKSAYTAACGLRYSIDTKKGL